MAQGTAGVATFTEQEYERRDQAVASLCESERLAALVVYGTSANARQGQAQVDYLTGFLGHQEAYVIAVPGRRPILFVQYANHVSNASRIARGEVRWGGLQSITAVADELAPLAAGSRVGLVGPIPYCAQQQLAGRLPNRILVDVSARFLRLRLVKSEQELEIMRRAAEVTDAALDALVRAAVPGSTELELQAAATAAAIRAGGQPYFLYLSSTPMANPDRIVPEQDLTERRLQEGDVVFFELSSSYGGYAGQVLRTLTIKAEPTPLYRRLLEVAWEAFHAVAASIRPGVHAGEVAKAGSIIETRGFTICDDLVHGYGGGYLPPVLRTPVTSHGPVGDFMFEEHMTVVIQPNVVTPDSRAGVQVGELVRVTRDGVLSLHRVPQRLLAGGEMLYA